MDFFNFKTEKEKIEQDYLSHYESVSNTITIIVD